MLYWQRDWASLSKPFWRVTGELGRRRSRERWTLTCCPLGARGERRGRGSAPAFRGGLSPSPEMPNLDFRLALQAPATAVPLWKIAICRPEACNPPNCLKGTHFPSVAFPFCGCNQLCTEKLHHTWITAGPTGHERPLCSKFCTRDEWRLQQMGAW